MSNVFLDSDVSENEDDNSSVRESKEFKVNEEYAKKFTYNKKREELRRLEDKLGNVSRKRKRDDEKGSNSESSEDGSSSDSETEDDAGELATEALDSEIMATLQAIRSKDPRVYDGSTTFYKSMNGDATTTDRAKQEKPMYLRDYHRENLLTGVKEEDAHQQTTYNEEQEALKRSIVGEINAAADVSSDASDEDDADEGFLVAKPKPKTEVKSKLAELDVENADKDPETFLSNFMSSRAWVPTSESKFQPFESDDENEERMAEEFEEAYNFRFEDPDKANEKLRSHARDMAAKYSVRREEKNSRQKARDTKRDKREAEKQILKEEKARLRKLKIEEMHEKVRRIKRAAGLKGESLEPEDWAEFVDEDWDDATWEEEMSKRFGDDYYADDDVVSDEEGQASANSKRKMQKPKWDDDIDIKDLVPDFEAETEAHFSLSDEELTELMNGSATMMKYKNSRKEDRKSSKKERRIIEQLVDNQLSMEPTLLSGSSKTRGFRYRETSPTSFGLTSRDILLADDAQLNQFAGIKKLATFRDPERKQKDRKHLGKKARLREWRKEIFGDENGLQDKELVPATVEAHVHQDALRAEGEEGSVDIRTGSKKKKRRRSSKPKGEAA